MTVTVGRVHRRAQGTAGKGVGEHVRDGTQEVVIVMAWERRVHIGNEECMGDGTHKRESTRDSMRV